VLLVLLVVLVVLVLVQDRSVKLPLSPIRTSLAEAFPVLLTCMVMVLVLPETDNETRLAVNCPVA